MAITRVGEFVDSGINGTVTDVNTGSFGWSTPLPIGDVSNTAFLEFNGNSSEIIQAEDLNLSGIGHNDETGTLTYSGVGNLPAFVTVLGTFRVFFNNNNYGNYVVSGTNTFTDIANIAVNTTSDDDNLTNRTDTFAQISAQKTTTVAGTAVTGIGLKFTAIANSGFQRLTINEVGVQQGPQIFGPLPGTNTNVSNGQIYNGTDWVDTVVNEMASSGHPVVNSTGTIMSINRATTGTAAEIIEAGIDDIVLAYERIADVNSGELYVTKINSSTIGIFSITDNNVSNWVVSNSGTSWGISLPVTTETTTTPAITSPSEPDEAYTFELEEDATLTVDNGRTFHLGNYLIQTVQPGSELIIRDGATIQYTGSPKRYTDGAGLNQGNGSNGIGGTFAKPFKITLKDAQFRITDLTNFGTPSDDQNLYNTNFFWSANGNSLRITQADFQDSTMYCNNNATPLTNNMPIGVYNNFKIIAEGNGTVFLPINGNTKFLDNFIIEDSNSRITLNGATSNVLIQPDGTSFSGGTDAAAKAFTYPTQAVMYRMNLIGPTEFSALQNRTTNQIYVNPVLTDSNTISSPYVGNYTFSNISNVVGGSAGTATIGTQINNRWLYSKEPLHNIIESAYYNNSETTLIPVLEAHSAGTFTSQGNQYHPWSDKNTATEIFKELVGDTGGAGGIARNYSVEFDTDGTDEDWIFNVSDADLHNFKVSQTVYVVTENSSGDITESETTIKSISVTDKSITVNGFTGGAGAASSSPSAELSTDTATYGNNLFWFEAAADTPKLVNQAHTYTTDTNGLADIRYQSDNELLSQTIYKGVVNDNNGYVAASLRSADDETPGESDAETTPYATSFDRYIRRDGFRPNFETVNFSDGELNTDTDLVASLDPYWQETEIDKIDQKARDLSTKISGTFHTDSIFIPSDTTDTVSGYAIHYLGDTNNLTFRIVSTRAGEFVKDDVVEMKVPGATAVSGTVKATPGAGQDHFDLQFANTSDFNALAFNTKSRFQIGQDASKLYWRAGNAFLFDAGDIDNTLKISYTGSANWNDIYRGIEYLENNNLITDANLVSETRPSTTDLNGRFIRFIDTDTPVDENGLINITDYNLELTIDDNITTSTDNNSLAGINLNNNTLTVNVTEDSTVSGTIKAYHIFDNVTSAKSFAYTNSNLETQTSLVVDGDLTNNTQVTLSGHLGANDITTNSIINITGSVSADNFDTITGTISGNIDIDEDVTSSTINGSGTLDIKGNIDSSTMTATSIDVTGTVDGTTITGSGAFESDDISNSSNITGITTFKVFGDVDDSTVTASSTILIFGNTDTSTVTGTTFDVRLNALDSIFNGTSFDITGTVNNCTITGTGAYESSTISNGSNITGITTATLNGDVDDSTIEASGNISGSTINLNSSIIEGANIAFQEVTNTTTDGVTEITATGTFVTDDCTDATLDITGNTNIKNSTRCIITVGGTYDGDEMSDSTITCTGNLTIDDRITGTSNTINAGANATFNDTIINIAIKGTASSLQTITLNGGSFSTGNDLSNTAVTITGSNVKAVINKPTSDSEIGTSTARIADADFNNDARVSATSAYSTASIELPTTVIGGVFDSSGDVTQSASTGTITNSTIIAGSEIDVSNVTGGSYTASVASASSITTANSFDITNKLTVTNNIVNSTVSVGTLEVVDIEGSQSVITVDDNLEMTTFEDGVLNINGANQTSTIVAMDDGTLNLVATHKAEIGSIDGGTINNGSIETANNINGGEFNSITFEDIITNVLADANEGAYDSANLELTNSGTVSYADAATGDATVTEGPRNAFDYENRGLFFGGLAFEWQQIGNAELVTIVDNSVTILSSGNPSNISSLTEDVPYFDTADGNTRYIRASLDSQLGDTFAYKLTKYDLSATQPTTKFNQGGVSISIATDNGINFTDNVEKSEFPFNYIVNVNNAKDIAYTVNGGATQYVSGDTFTLDSSSADRGDDIIIAAMGTNFAPIYTTRTIPLTTGIDEVVTINIDLVSAPYSSTVDDSAVTFNSVTFNSSNQLVIDFADVVQAGDIMSKAILDNIYSSQNDTLDAILHYKDPILVAPLGVFGLLSIDSTKVKVTSSTASGVGTKETFPFFAPLGASTDAEVITGIRNVTSLDDFLGNSYVTATGATSLEVNSLLNTQFNGRLVTAENEERKGKLIPVDETSTQIIE